MLTDAMLRRSRYDALMRVKVTIDDELAHALEHVAKRTNKPFEQVVNETLRAGLSTTGARPSKPCQATPASLGGVSPGLDLDRALAIADGIEGQELAIRMRLRR